jgi:hypothetical protein
MHEDVPLRALPLVDRLRITAVDLAVTGAPRVLVEAVCLAVDGRLPVVPPGANPGGGEGGESTHAQDRARDPGALTACHGPDDADQEDHRPE